jgi:hypothetical protein
LFISPSSRATPFSPGYTTGSLLPRSSNYCTTELLCFTFPNAKQSNKHYLQILYHIRTWHLAEETRLHGAIDVHRPLEPRLVPRLLAHLQHKSHIKNYMARALTAESRHHCRLPNRTEEHKSVLKWVQRNSIGPNRCKMEQTFSECAHQGKVAVPAQRV